MLKCCHLLRLPAKYVLKHRRLYEIQHGDDLVLPLRDLLSVNHNVVEPKPDFSSYPLEVGLHIELVLLGEVVDHLGKQVVETRQ